MNKIQLKELNKKIKEVFWFVLLFIGILTNAGILAFAEPLFPSVLFFVCVINMNIMIILFLMGI